MDLPAPASVPCPCSSGAVSVTRTPQGWAVVSPAGSETTGDLVEGLTIADLLTEELGGSVDPDRATRRSARAARSRVRSQRTGRYDPLPPGPSGSRTSRASAPASSQSV